MPLTKEQALKYISAHVEFEAKNDIAGLLNSCSDDVLILGPHDPPIKGKKAIEKVRRMQVVVIVVVFVSCMQ